MSANAISQHPLHVGFIHPDLGIGGAERLVVDAAVSLQNQRHRISVFTAHCDPTHAFVETQDGLWHHRMHHWQAIGID
jgi:alpha-1,3/alpha-1,6-mannosyltransferase